MDPLKAYKRQGLNARHRGIPFLLTFEEWWNWWQIDDRWARRGRKSGCLVMARFGDKGPYSLENIYCSIHSDNFHLGMRLSNAYKRGAATRRLTDENFARHLRDRARHPCARPVISPKGAFPSISLAAEANGLKPQYAQKLVAAGAKGWSYAQTILEA